MFISGQASTEGNETEEKLVEQTLRLSIRNREEDRDRISELPNGVLLHIMEFMKAEDAVKTCVLSKRWENLWKGLATLKLYSWRSSVPNYNKFLSRRDGYISLLNLDILIRNFSELKLLNNIMDYAVLHNVQHMKAFLYVPYKFHLVFPSIIFSCPSLTLHHLRNSCRGPIWKLPKSLQLPALKSLYLDCVCFTASDDNNCAEPFSSCVLLNSLVLIECSLHEAC
ncbi:F-box/FBD/LRR-repeat protein [Spatholobus suberectus]|nr:F-box/FBD/LRR-repeat protein [Spatholobus suberectus]